MKKKLLLLVSLLFSLSAIGQDTDFWFVAPQTGTAQMSNGGFMFTNTSSMPANVTITYFRDGSTDSFTIPAQEGYHHVVAAADAVAKVENPFVTSGQVVNGGMHIQSTQKLIGYYFFDAAGTKDIYLLKGAHALGKTFYVSQSSDGFYTNGDPGSGNNYPNAYDQIDIVATENGTTIQVTPTRDCVNTAGANFTAGTTYTFVLNRGQVLKMQETVHGTFNTFNTLAGTKIVSDKPIAVSSSEEVTNHDLCADQIVPVNRLGTLYPIVKAYSNQTLPGGWAIYSLDRIYVLAVEDGTDVYITTVAGGAQTKLNGAPLNAGQSVSYNMGDLNGAPYAAGIYTTKPAACWVTSAQSYHPGAAIVPSIYSVGQSKFSFYQMGGSVKTNAISLVFRDTCENYFKFSYGGTEYDLNAVCTINSFGQMPGIPGWSYIRAILPPAANGQMVTVSNDESVFSLGYFAGDHLTEHYCTFGYISGFGDWEFPYDTIWRCQGTRYTTLMGGYAKDYKWTLPDGSVKQGPQHSVLQAVMPGKYVLEMDQDRGIPWIKDSVWILDMAFNAKINRLPRDPKPAKIGVPQAFTVDMNASLASMTTCSWTFEGGIPATSNSFSPTVVWNSTGEKKVTLHLSATGGSGANQTNCDTTIVAYYKVKPKNIGYFVNENGGNDNNEGSSWPEAFSTVQRALDYASQGDYIWVARGNYNPGGDHLTYVVDYDSVQIYGGFRGHETNLNERDIASNPTILNGRDNSVVTFDGSVSYTNGTCGTGTDTRLDGFIIQNGKAKNGAGIQFINGASGTIAHCVIRQNVAEQRGGGIYTIAPLCNHNSPILINTEVSGNQAANGAGIYNDGSDLLAINVTVSGNGAGNTGGGLYNAGGNPDIRNTIIFGNKGQNDNTTDVLNSGGTPLYAYSVVGGSNGSGSTWNNALGTDGGKNKDGSPLFKKSGYDQFGNIQEGNYRLTGSSNSVNSGRNAYVLQGIHTPWNVNLLNPKEGKSVEGIRMDLDGMNRIAYDIVDRGAYEYDPNADYTAPVHEVNIPVFENLTTDPPASRHWVTGHESFTLVIMPGSGYSLEHMTITSGSAKQDEKMTQIKNADGSVTIIFHQITEALNIRIENVSPTSNLSIDGYAVWSYNNQLHIKATMEGMLKIYTLNGQLYKQQPVVAGETSIALPQGVYVVSLDEGTKQKVVIK